MKISMHVLLVMAMVIAPYTLLRFGLLGFAEILVLVVFLAQVARGVRKSEFPSFVLTKFWLAYLVVALVGSFVNAVILEEQTSTWPQVAFDLAAYVFILATCFSLERMATHSGFDVRRFVADFVLWSGLAFSLLYITSRFSSSLFGLPLLYYDYFVPWAENLHQISMALVPLPFLAIASIPVATARVRKVVLAALVPMTMLMAVSTGSSKAFLSMYVGAFAMAYAFALVKLGRRWFLQVNLFFAAIALVVVASSDWVRVSESLFEENDLGGVRGFLYQHAVEVGLQSPLVGHGPGPHIELLGSYMDAHQTWLTAFLQAGLPGLLLFTVLVLHVLRRLIYQPALLAAFSTLVVYAAGGDILRRLPAWIVIFAVVHYLPTPRQSTARLQRSALDSRQPVRS